MPDANGNIRGIRVPPLPWLEARWPEGTTAGKAMDDGTLSVEVPKTLASKEIEEIAKLRPWAGTD